MRFYEGQLVRITSDFKIINGWSDNLRRLAGTVQEVESVMEKGAKCRLRNVSFVWTLAEIDWENTPDTSPKKLLKSGDLVELLGGGKRFVLLETGRLYLANGDTSESLTYYDENLLYAGYSAVIPKDIMKITRGDTLIWKREEESPEALEMEHIEMEQRRLADRLAELRKKGNL